MNKSRCLSCRGKKESKKRDKRHRAGAVSTKAHPVSCLGAIRGSGERADRPRAILAMMRRQLRMTGAK